MAHDYPYVRDGSGAVRSYLYGPLALLEFVEHAFGAEELARFEVGPNAFHFEMRIGDSPFVMELADPPHESGSPGTTYVYVPDADAAYARALEKGAVSIFAPEDKPYEERQAGVRDAYGNTWWISTWLGRG